MMRNYSSRVLATGGLVRHSRAYVSRAVTLQRKVTDCSQSSVIVTIFLFFMFADQLLLVYMFSQLCYPLYYLTHAKIAGFRFKSNQ